MSIENIRTIRIESSPLHKVVRIDDNQRIIAQHSRYLSDESKMKGHADSIFVPRNESEILAVVDHVREKGGSITISGMRTGVVGGAVPKGGSVLSLERMDSLLGLGKDEIGFYVRVQPNLTLAELNRRLARKKISDIPEIMPGVIDLIGKDQRLFYPVDPTEQNGSLGGNVAANSSGARSYLYGATRDWVRRLRIMLSNGDILDITRGEQFFHGRRIVMETSSGPLQIDLPSYEFRKGVKNAAGIYCQDDMDLVDLFIGSEGIFGIITEIELRLLPWHPVMSVIMFFPNDQSALGFAQSLREEIHTISPEFIEYFDGGALDLIRSLKEEGSCLDSLPGIPVNAGAAVFFDIPYSDPIKDRFLEIADLAQPFGGSMESSWCAHEKVDRQRFQTFRHSIPESIFQHVSMLKGSHPQIHKMGTDMSVPDDKFPQMMSYYKQVLEELGLEWVTFGHIGDNHPHVEIILHDMDDFQKGKEACRKFAEKAIELGGSPSAEHGIGKMKKEYLHLLYGDQGVAQILGMKKTLDPIGLFNKGNLVEWT